MKNKYMNKKAFMSYTQMLILIIATFAFCYLIYDATNAVSAADGSFNIGNYGCCEETTDGNTCQYVSQNNCTAGSQRSPNLCENTAFCAPGCCFSAESGLCSESTPKVSCDNSNGIWSSGVCNNQQCERRCCVLGSQAKFTTEKNCEIESGFLGIPMDFRTDINNEVSCIFLVEKDDEGACVFESGDATTCLYITKEECFSRTGNENDFYKDTFCSDSELNTDCSAQDYDGCVDGEDSVYWYDSCGNKEDVKEECSIFLSSVCGKYRDGIDTSPSSGEYVCRSLDCRADNGNNYKNGESWCEYEGTVGDGRDVVGSRHVKHICFMGEERIEPCADYRNQICVGTEIPIGNGKTFSEAVCRQNNWQDCFEKNKRIDGVNEDDNPDCIVRGVHVDDFNFDMVVPKYPPGFDLKNNKQSADSICSMGSQTCTVIYVKKWDIYRPKWKCEYNCDCEKSKFTQQMNELCTSLGDCGGYVNIEGEYTDEGYTSRAGGISGNQYEQYARPRRNLDIIESESLDILGQSSYANNQEDGNGGIGALGMAALGLQGVQLLGLTKTLAASSISGIGTALGGGAGSVGAVQRLTSSIYSQSSTISAEVAQKTATSQVGFGNLFASIGAGLAVASILQMGFGVEQGSALIIGAAVAVVLLVGITQAWWSSTLVTYLGYFGLAFIMLMMFMGIGDTDEREITFQCLPWQAPNGGEDCSKCDSENEFDVPCTEYKCNSLGKGCDLINKGSEDQRCIDICPANVISPRIEVGDNITTGYEYRNPSNSGVEIRTDNGGCIPEYTEVEYEIKTENPSQCKIGHDIMQTYEEMNIYLGNSNSYLTEHKSTLFMPSIPAFRNRYNLTQAQIESLGEIKYHIKCKEPCEGRTNIVPFTIETCIKPGPDITAPVIRKVSPDSGAFVKYGESEKNVTVWVNEPANCRWDINDIIYDDMTNDMICQTGFGDRELYGWPCETTLTGANANSIFYFRCKDGPAEPDDSKRNPMSEGYPYELDVSSSPLSIIDFKPEYGYEFLKGTEPVSLSLNVRTAGGAENGKAVCGWEGNGYSDLFQQTDSDYHSYDITSATRGNYNIDFNCVDVAGNNASASTSFEITIDTSGPRIIRVYFKDGLKIVTNEEAECRYDFTRSFNFNKAIEMSGDGIEHFADWKLKTYYIQCEDQFNRKGRKIRVKAYDLI